MRRNGEHWRRLAVEPSERTRESRKLNFVPATVFIKVHLCNRNLFQFSERDLKVKPISVRFSFRQKQLDRFMDENPKYFKKARSIAHARQLMETASENYKLFLEKLEREKASSSK